MGKFIDLVGQRFGMLTVIKRVEDYIQPSGQHKTQWLCKCDCGNDVAVLGNNLIKGNTKACGCIRNKDKKKHNQYDLSGDYGISYTSKGQKFYFDLEDYDLIKKYCWKINKNGYVLSSNGVFMHRVIMNCPNELVVDHINGEESRNDNRKSNLRIATPSQNCMNRKIQSNNTSGITGVYFDKDKNKWFSTICISHNSIHLGYFDNKEDAIKARKDAEEKYFGEWSYDNSQKININ